jgi:SAM-dependent methyltransferase
MLEAAMRLADLRDRIFRKHRRSRATLELLVRLLERGSLSTQDEVLVVAGGPFEREMFLELGFGRVTLTNLEGDQPVDARALPYADGQFDLAFIEGALHHVDRPHQAIYELVRVSRRSVILAETQDHWLQRGMLRLGLGEPYELSAVRAHGGRSGGVNNTGVPNYVYRWGPGELEKVFRCLDAARAPHLEVAYAWDLYGKGGLAGALACGIGQRIAPSLGNQFALHYDKVQSRLQPWLALRNGAPHLREG